MKLAPLFVLLIAGAIAVPALSNPLGAHVVNGSVIFSQSGNVLTVTNSNGAIINWNKFSIAAGETTHFNQPSASSNVLNRVMGDPTVIYGTLSSNGHVWLVNPSGIMIGSGGRIDTAGFVASTLHVSDIDFLAGRHVFVDGGTSHNIINQGEIRLPPGGSVYLVGTNVTNGGTISAPQGEAILAAGATVNLSDTATPGVRVDITGSAGDSTNLGAITADAGSIVMAGVNVRNSGLLRANNINITSVQGVFVTGEGAITATGDMVINAGSDITVTGVVSGGSVTLTGGGEATLLDETAAGGNLTLFGGSITNRSGTITTGAGSITIGSGNIAIAGSSSGGSLSLTSGKLAVPADARKLLQRTAGSIALRGAPSIQTSAPTPSPASTPPALRASAPAARLVNTGGLVDGAVTVRLSLVDAAPISLR